MMPIKISKLLCPTDVYHAKYIRKLLFMHLWLTLRHFEPTKITSTLVNYYSEDFNLKSVKEHFTTVLWANNG